jgi:tetratricopeptide (TPR) repeat protein
MLNEAGSLKESVSQALDFKKKGQHDIAYEVLQKLIPKDKTGLAANHIVSILHSLLIDKWMVNDFLNELGWSENQFHGFDHLKKDCLQNVTHEKVWKEAYDLAVKFPKYKITAYMVQNNAFLKGYFLDQDFPKNTRSYMPIHLYIKGQKLLLKKQKEEALDCFLLAGIIAPSFHQAYIKASQILLELASYKSALTFLNQAVSCPVNMSWRHFSLSRSIPIMPIFIEKFGPTSSLFHWRGLFFCCSPFWTKIFIKIQLFRKKILSCFEKFFNPKIKNKTHKVKNSHLEFEKISHRLRRVYESHK